MLFNRIKICSAQPLLPFLINQASYVFVKIFSICFSVLSAVIRLCNFPDDKISFGRLGKFFAKLLRYRLSGIKKRPETGRFYFC